jgi:hypothetical protein
MTEKKSASKIVLLRERMVSDVKPLMDDDTYEDLMDLLHMAIIEAFEKGRRTIR